MRKSALFFILLVVVMIVSVTGCPFFPMQSDYDDSTTTYSGDDGYDVIEGDAYEIDNTKSQASVLSSVQYHSIHKRTDIDFMKINVLPDKTYNISLSEIDGFYPEVSLYHQDEANPFFTISPFIDSWDETVVYTSDVNETLYISVKSRYQADLYGTYKIGFTAIDTVMDTPTGLSATDGTYENRIAVSWNATVDADSYEIYRASDGNNFTKIGESTLAYYEDVTSDQNQMSTSIEYVYKVRGKKASGAVSSFSNSDIGYLKDFGQITDLSANVINGVIRLTWTEIPGVTSYRIYRSAGSTNDFSLLTTQTGSPYDVTSSQPEVVYYFYVIPVKNGINGFKSNTVSATIPFTSYRPNAPTASDSVISQINITWGSVDGATGYQLYRADDISGPYSQIGIDLGSSTLGYEDYSVSPGSYYYYRIRVIKNAQYSDYSYSDSGIATD